MSEIELKYPEYLKACFDHSYDDKVCFLCACELDNETKTKEHVIPKWVQEKYQLWDKRLTLLNGTQIFYRQLFIPCCESCNNDLSSLESTIRNAIDEGVNAVRSLPRFLLLKWLIKIFLGLLYKELFLRWDLKKPEDGNIMHLAYLREKFAILHFWLQVSMFDDKYDFNPGSVFIFETETSSVGNFDLLDCPHDNTIAIRLDSVGLVADFLENGLHYKLMEEHLPWYENLIFNPIQFREMASKIFYKASLLDIKTQVEFSEINGNLCTYFEYELMSGDESAAFRDWDWTEYAKCLSFYTGLPLDEVFIPPDKIVTWLPNE